MARIGSTDLSAQFFLVALLLVVLSNKFHVVVQMPEARNWWNIRLAGKTKSIPENNTMWNVLTTASATPILEIDILGPDAWELLGFPDQAKFSVLQSGALYRNIS